MSGCPNGCSQHHLANIGFYGAAMKVNGHQMPAYIPHLAGSYDEGDVTMGKRLKSRIPAKRVPDAVERWVRHYEENRNDGEQFNDFVERVGTEAVRGPRQGPLAAGRVRPRAHHALHRLEPQASSTRWSAARASARSDRRRAHRPAPAARLALSSIRCFQSAPSV